MIGELLISHVLVWLFGFGLGGLAAYKLIMHEIESSVESMFSFDQGSELIDELTEVEQKDE